MLDEAAQLGHLGPIEDALGQARGYGIALWPVFQDWNQLRELYGPRAETFAGASGAVFGFAPAEMQTAEWMSKRSGEETIMGMTAGESETGEIRGPRANYSAQTRRVLPPHELLNLPLGDARPGAGDFLARGAWSRLRQRRANGQARDRAPGRHLAHRPPPTVLAGSTTHAEFLTPQSRRHPARL